MLRQRLERLACDFDISDNYFAAQAFGGRYAEGEAASLPPYLQRRHFDTLRDRADRLSFVQGSLTANARRRAGGELRRLCSARRARLDERLTS